MRSQKYILQLQDHYDDVEQMRQMQLDSFLKVVQLLEIHDYSGLTENSLTIDSTRLYNRVRVVCILLQNNVECFQHLKFSDISQQFHQHDVCLHHVVVRISKHPIRPVISCFPQSVNQ